MAPRLHQLKVNYEMSRLVTVEAESLVQAQSIAREWFEESVSYDDKIEELEVWIEPFQIPKGIEPDATLSAEEPA